MQGDNLRKARQRAGLTLRALSERSGVHAATICDIEQGRNRRPGYDKVVALARACGVSPDDLWPLDTPHVA